MKRLLLILLMIPSLIMAQDSIVSGVVFDDTGNPLPGATVSIKGSDGIGSITDFDGNFSVNVPEGSDTLIFSYIGFLESQVNITGKSTVNVNLSPDVSELDEVVVVGYGTVLKRDLTGSVASVKVEDNIARQSVTIDQLLQGRAAGVQVTQNAANPNSGISVRIRGTNSLRGNNEPLYVVDGVIISSAGEGTQGTGGFGNTGQEQQNGLNGINPRDIESMQILKDASATAIYGSRGANGVVLITTKKGKKGKSDINVFYSSSYRSLSKRIDVLDPMEYINYDNDVQEWAGNTRNWELIDGTVFGYSGNVLQAEPASLNDWQDEILQVGKSTNFGASVSGGSEKGDYYISAGFNDQAGLVKNSGFKSGDIRINVNQKVTDNLTVEARFSAFFSESDFAEGGDLIGNKQSFVRNILSFRPANPSVIDDFTDPDLAQDDDDFNANPYTWIDDYHDESVEDRLIGSLSVKYDFPIKGLSYEFKAGGNTRSKDRRRFYGVTTFQGAVNNGMLVLNGLNQKSYQVNNFLRFNRNFNKNHRVNATLGVTYDVREVEKSVYIVTNFDSTQLTVRQPFLGSNITTPLAFIAQDQKMFSLLGRFNYTFRDKYVLTSTFRRDGVSKFSEDNRYGFFPSFAFAWRAGSEDFIKDLDLFSNLKLRAGWGQIGNHGIGSYATLSNFGSDPNVLYGTPGNGTTIPLILNNIANEQLTWETTEQINVGVDFGFLNGRISGTVDVYDKTTKDLLQVAPIPTSSGFSNISLNRGELENKGIEFGLDIAALESEDLNLSIGGNIAFNRTKIVNLGLPAADILIDGKLEKRAFYQGQSISRGQHFSHPANAFIDGEEAALFYGWKTDGIFQQDDQMYLIDGVMSEPGDLKVVDSNDDGEVNTLDRTIIGNPNPDFVYGFNINASYKNLSLSMLFNGVEGNQIANGATPQLGTAMAEGGNFARNIMSDAYFNAWTPENPNTIYPKVGYQKHINRRTMTDNFLEDGSYLRLNNVTLAYDVPVNELFGGATAFKPSKLSVYVTGQNLFTWTDYTGFDPEVTSFMWTGLIQGVDWHSPPNAKNILVGINMNF
jgi:TonB-linked SusC/RagA family outer membrane protein